MKQIRLGVFETNSSSTHSMVIGTEDQIAKWEAGELFVDGYDTCATVFKTEVELDEMEANATKEDSFYREDWVTSDGWDALNGDLECDSHTFVTPNGDKMVAVVAYGYSG